MKKNKLIFFFFCQILKFACIGQNFSPQREILPQLASLMTAFVRACYKSIHFCYMRSVTPVLYFFNFAMSHEINKNIIIKRKTSCKN